MAPPSSSALFLVKRLALTIECAVGAERYRPPPAQVDYLGRLTFKACARSSPAERPGSSGSMRMLHPCCAVIHWGRYFGSMRGQPPHAAVGSPACLATGMNGAPAAGVGARTLLRGGVGVEGAVEDAARARVHEQAAALLALPCSQAGKSQNSACGHRSQPRPPLPRNSTSVP